MYQTCRKCKTSTDKNGQQWIKFCSDCRKANDAKGSVPVSGLKVPLDDLPNPTFPRQED